MASGTLQRRIGTLAMGLAPLAAAMGTALLLARDSMELASAAIAVGGALSLACLIQLSALVRQTRRLGEKQDHMRAQALALARCMKALNARLADAESRAPAAQERAGDEPPAQERASVPALSALESSIVLASLGDAAVWGIEVAAQAEDPVDPDAALAGRIVRALTGFPGSVGHRLVCSSVPPSVTPKALALARALVAAQPGFGESFVLGFTQSAMRAGGEVDLVAQLARAGVRMALTDVGDTRLDGQALRDCNFVAVLAPHAGLGQAGAGMADTHGFNGLPARLAAVGVALVSRPGKAAAQQNGDPKSLAPVHAPTITDRADGEPVIIPWRALPAPQTRRASRFPPILNKAS